MERTRVYIFATGDTKVSEFVNQAVCCRSRKSHREDPTRLRAFF
jgi:hypothetical protein